MKGNENFPDEALRGIKKGDIQSNTITIGAFQFKNERKDGYEECSINWLDDNGAIDDILKRKDENGKKQYYAAVHINRNNIDMILKDYIKSKKFNYERNIIDNNNNYHGNLLLKPAIGKCLKRYVQTILAFMATNDEINYQKDN